jgi:hypothetical protein
MKENRVLVGGVVVLTIVVSVVLSVGLSLRQQETLFGGAADDGLDLPALLSEYASRAADDPDFQYRIVTTDDVEYRSEDFTFDRFGSDHVCLRLEAGASIGGAATVPAGETAYTCIPTVLVRAIYFLE